MLSFLLPSRCPVCGLPGPAPCPPCWSKLRPAPAADPPAGVDRCQSLLRYEGAGREVLARLKYRNSRAAVAWLAEGMAALAVDSSPCGRPPLEVVTWAPTSKARRRQRGFDQAELLAKAVAHRLALPARPLLARMAGPSQTGLGREERQGGPAFSPLGPTAGVSSVLLVDDVLTTGATVAAAASVLRHMGVQWITAVTAGRTGLKVHRPRVDA